VRPVAFVVRIGARQLGPQLGALRRHLAEGADGADARFSPKKLFNMVVTWRWYSRFTSVFGRLVSSLSAASRTCPKFEPFKNLAII